MADTKLSALTELAVTPADADQFYINDGGVSKRITYGTIKTDFGKVAQPLSQFAATTSAQLAGVISDETGTGALVFANSPTMVTPALGTPASGVLTNCTGTAAGLTAGNVTTNANLTGHVTSTGNAAVLGSFTFAQLNTAVSDATLISKTTNTQVFALACSDETTALTTGTGKGEFQIVDGAFTLTGIYATVTTAPTGSTIIVDVNLNGTTLMTTNKISIDASEKTSDTAATPPTLTTTALTENGVITVDIDQIGSSTAGAGLKVYLVGYWT